MTVCSHARSSASALRMVHVPMGRFAEAVELANAVLFLASEESSYITASTFMVDGGIGGAYVTAAVAAANCEPSERAGSQTFTRGAGMAEAGTAQKRSTGEDVGSDYLEKRQLQQGAAGWVLLAGLGVAYVISGDFAGWNFGLAEGGWGGLLIATILMATMYTCMVFALAELSSAIPTAGGGYGFARRALGRVGRVPDRHGDPDRVRDRPGRDRRVHRRLRRVARHLRDHERLARLPRLLRGLRRRAPARRGRGAQGDVRHHRDRGRRAASCSWSAMIPEFDPRT